MVGESVCDVDAELDQATAISTTDEKTGSATPIARAAPIAPVPPSRPTVPTTYLPTGTATCTGEPKKGGKPEAGTAGKAAVIELGRPGQRTAPSWQARDRGTTRTRNYQSSGPARSRAGAGQRR